METILAATELYTLDYLNPYFSHYSLLQYYSFIVLTENCKSADLYVEFTEKVREIWIELKLICILN